MEPRPKRWRDRSNEELIAAGRAYTHKPECMCGLCVYSRLFTAITELKCKCPDPDWMGFTHVNVWNIGTFCTMCGLLHYTSLANNILPCESCGKFFSYDYRQFLPQKPFDAKSSTRLPFRNHLCRRCDVPAPPGVNGRSRFRIN